jgi:hypothetical protein
MVFETNQPQHYREQAEKLRRMAADSAAGEVREQLLMLAGDYDKLAVRAAKDPQPA